MKVLVTNSIFFFSDATSSHYPVIGHENSEWLIADRCIIYLYRSCGLFSFPLWQVSCVETMWHCVRMWNSTEFNIFYFGLPFPTCVICPPQREELGPDAAQSSFLFLLLDGTGHSQRFCAALPPHPVQGPVSGQRYAMAEWNTHFLWDFSK